MSPEPMATSPPFATKRPNRSTASATLHYRLRYLLQGLPCAGWCLPLPGALVARLRRRAGLIVVGAIVVVSLFYIPLIWPAQWDDAWALALHARGLLRDRAGDLAGALAD